MLNNKAQTEITNIIFMHMMGLIGILTFTLLFVSLISSSSGRAEGLKVDTVYYNYGRRLIASPDCFAFSRVETYYARGNIYTFSRTIPGIIDVSKVFDYNHKNCLRYDLISGAATADPGNPFASYPVLFYEITIRDETSNNSFVIIQNGQTTTNNIGVYTSNSDVYVGTTQGVTYKLCDKAEGPEGCDGDGDGEVDCMYDCDELAKYIQYNSSAGTSTETYNDIICQNENRNTNQVIPGVNCWTKEFNDVTRIVQPYSEAPPYQYINTSDGTIIDYKPTFNCSLPSSFEGTTEESGNVFEKTLSYPVVLRYPGFVNKIRGLNETRIEDMAVADHVGTFIVRFCVIKIPTMCDPFFKYTYDSTIGGELFGDKVYDPNSCKSGGLPII